LRDLVRATNGGPINFQRGKGGKDVLEKPGPSRVPAWKRESEKKETSKNGPIPRKTK